MAWTLILLSVLVTGLLTTMAITSGTEAQIANITLDRDQAFFAAEAGIQNALWQARYNNWAASAFPALAGSAGSANYTATGVSNPDGSISVLAVGTVGQPVVSNTIHCTFTGAYPIPAIELGGAFSGGGGDHVTGNMMAAGSITHHGNFSVSQGNVYSSSTIDASIGVDPGYALYPNASIPAAPSVTAIANTLKSNPHAVTIASSSTLDFRTSSNGLLIYNGNITNWRDPTIYSDGTLVVFGSVSTKSMTTFTSHNVNLVIVGDLTVGGGSKFNLQGSLYVSGLISTQSQFTVQGVILANGSMTTQGQGSDISLLAPPWFDPRLTSPLGGYITAKFTGPIY